MTRFHCVYVNTIDLNWDTTHNADTRVRVNLPALAGRMSDDLGNLVKPQKAITCQLKQAIHVLNSSQISCHVH